MFKNISRYIYLFFGKYWHSTPEDPRMHLSEAPKSTATPSEGPRTTPRKNTYSFREDPTPEERLIFLGERVPPQKVHTSMLCRKNKKQKYFSGRPILPNKCALFCQGGGPEPLIPPKK